MNLVTGLPPWTLQAACADPDVVHPDAFFPENGNGPEHACAVCTGCPVRAACLAYAMDRERSNHTLRYGIWGGLTPKQRRQLERQQPACIDCCRPLSPSSNRTTKRCPACAAQFRRASYRSYDQRQRTA